MLWRDVSTLLDTTQRRLYVPEHPSYGFSGECQRTEGAKGGDVHAESRKKISIAERRAAGRIPPPSVSLRDARIGGHSGEFSGKEPRKLIRSSTIIFGSWGPGTPDRKSTRLNSSH